MTCSINILIENNIILTGEIMKTGFTLAETLITLGIIGIVAAMTIPTLISKNQKSIIEANLKETYSILQQTMRLAENDDIGFDPIVPEAVPNLEKWFKTYFAPYMKYTQICYDTQGCWHTKGPTKNLNGATAFANRTNIGLGSSIITVRLNNGATLNLDSYSKSDAKTYHGIDSNGQILIIYIDANGDKGPNVIGKDIYSVGFTAKGLIPAGSNETNETVNKNCSKNATARNAGHFCLMRVKNNGWEIPNDVWNKKI